tara:strand:- start:340 stop:561 length:222 start_codon:yes stop_codon:yes gene_type:complete
LASGHNSKKIVHNALGNISCVNVEAGINIQNIEEGNVRREHILRKPGDEGVMQGSDPNGRWNSSGFFNGSEVD